MEALLRFDNVSKQYPNGVHALNGVSFTVGEGEFISVIGPSGSGKSTLLRAINRLIPISGGTVLLEGEAVSRQWGRALRALRRKVGMIFQNYNLVYSLSVLQNVLHGRLGYMRGLKGIFGLYSEADKRQALDLLEELGLGEFSYNRASDLSGGQKQRVGIARALATNPEILLADEATSALDPETTTEVLALLKRVNEEFGITIVLITHQMNVVQQIAGRVAVMSAGRVVESGDVYDVFAAPQQPVTKRFIATALSGLPEEDRVERLHHEWSGRIVTVLIRQKDVSGTQGHELKASGQNISELIAKYGVESSLLYGGIDTVKGTAIGAITYEFNGPGWHVDEFLRELAANSDVIDFGTAAKPVAYADAVAGHASYAEDRAHDPLAADTATAPAASAAAHEGANA